MRRKLFLLLAAVLAVTGIGWGQEQPLVESLLLIEGDTCYANGNSITITQSDIAGNVKISVTENETDSYELTSANAVVFGGKKNESTDNSTIIMKSGKVKNIYGGGNGRLDQAGAKKSADIINKTSIHIEGGKITNLLVGGGRYYANSNQVEILITGLETVVNHIISGGFDEGKTTNELSTSFDNSVNKVTKSNLTIMNSKIEGYLFMGGGQGYSYSKQVNAELENVTINGGVLGTGSNGRSDKVKIVAKNCIFEKANTDPIEIAAINRGRVDTISMIFDNCTFPKDSKDYYCCLGATYNWTNSGRQPEKPSVGNVSFEFKNTSTNKPAPVVKISDGLDTATVALKGAKAIVDEFIFNAGSGSKTTEFKVAKDKTWTFSNGIKKGSATLVNDEGMLVVSAVSTLDLKDAIDIKADTLNLISKEYTVAESLPISYSMTLNGNNAILKTAKEFKKGNVQGSYNVINVFNESDQKVVVNIKDISIDGSEFEKSEILEYTGGLNLQNVNATLENIISRNNLASGITVGRLSSVTASDIKTSGNKWGGINVGLGAEKSDTILFKLEGTNNELTDKLPIYVDKVDTVYINVETSPKILLHIPDVFTRVTGNDGEAVWVLKKQEATSDNLDDLINQKVPEIVLKPEEGETEIVITEPLKIPEDAKITIKSDDAEKPVTIVAPTGKPAITIPEGATFALENVVIESKTAGQAAIQINKATSTGGTPAPTPVSLSGSKFVGNAIAVEEGMTGVKIKVDSCNFNPVSIPATASSSILRTEDQVINQVISVGDNETTINRCIFKGIQNEGAIISGTNIVVANSLFADNKDMQLMDLSSLTNVTKIQLINNTFINPTSAGKDIIAFPGNTTNKENVQKKVVIANNILWTKATQSISGKLDGANIKNNALKNTDIAIAAGNLTNIILSSIPTFKGNGDYHLPNNSPLVAKGDATYVVGEKDIEGETRLTGGKINLGAYEKTYAIDPDDPGLAPTVEAPKVADRKDTSAKIEWVKVTNATTYQLRVYTGSDKSTMVGNVYEVANPATSVSFAVTGLEKGKAYYGVASAYKGDRTIIVRKEFDITKSNTVGIEEIFAGSRVYTSGKNLCIEPSQDVKVTVIGMDGKILLNETISQKVIVPIANSGIYAVTFNDGKSQATQKVAVF